MSSGPPGGSGVGTTPGETHARLGATKGAELAPARTELMTQTGGN